MIKKRNRKQDRSETLKKICVTDDSAALTRELKTVKEFRHQCKYVFTL